MTRTDVAPAATTAQALDQLAADAELAAPHELADLIDRCSRGLGAQTATAYVTDLQQHVLQPLLPPDTRSWDEPLDVDATLAGRAYQTLQPQQQDEGDGTRVWLPLVSGIQRLGVLSVLLAGTPDDALLASLTGSRTPPRPCSSRRRRTATPSCGCAGATTSAWPRSCTTRSCRR